VQAILAELKEADHCENDGDENDYFFQHKDAPIHYNVVDNDDLVELEENRTADLEREDEDDPLAELLGGISLGDKLEPDVDSIGEQSPLKRVCLIDQSLITSPDSFLALLHCDQDLLFSLTTKGILASVEEEVRR
jgi:hypothetical protein